MGTNSEERRKAKLARGAAAQRKWAAANPDKVRETQRKKYLARRDEFIALAKKYAEENRDQIRAYQRDYRGSPTGSAARTNAEYRRRAKMRGNDSGATNAEIRTLLATATNCKYCSHVFDDARRPTLDHVIPLSKGGPHSLDNLAAACAVCNAKKGARLDFAANFT